MEKTYKNKYRQLTDHTIFYFNLPGLFFSSQACKNQPYNKFQLSGVNQKLFVRLCSILLLNLCQTYGPKFSFRMPALAQPVTAVRRDKVTFKKIISTVFWNRDGTIKLFESCTYTCNLLETKSFLLPKNLKRKINYSLKWM